MKTKYHSIFVSDLHLGAGESQADAFASFMKQFDCDNLYMVGDMIDGWKMRRRWYWPQSHSNALRRVLTKAKRGCRIVYVTGNHDEFLRDLFVEHGRFGDIEIVNEIIYTDVKNRRWLVTHGDMFDQVTRHYRWISLLGDRLYTMLLWSNRLLHVVRNRLGLSHWSLSQYIKSNTKQALNFIYKFEEHLVAHAEKQSAQGVICGHIHTPAMKMIGNLHYINTGDFCETCSAVAETPDGQWHLLMLDADGNWFVQDML